MNCQFQQSAYSGILVITGKMGVEQAEELKSHLAEALEQSARTEIDLSGVESVNLCCLQLLCAAHKAAEQSGKTLEIRGAGEGFRGCVEGAGLIRHAGCMDETGSVCFWLETDGDR
jgi:ABC-type transporter Mla MlaB component